MNKFVKVSIENFIRKIKCSIFLKAFLLYGFIWFVPESNLSQIIKTDTITFSEDYKKILVVQEYGSHEKYVSGKDTTIIKSNEFYYEYLIEEYCKTDEYKQRDTVDFGKLEYLVIKFITDINYCIGGKGRDYLYLIYDKALKSEQKGIKIGLYGPIHNTVYRYGKIPIEGIEKVVGCLNKNMAFNKTKLVELHSEDWHITTGSSHSHMEIILKEKGKKEIKRVLAPNNTILYSLHVQLERDLIFVRKDMQDTGREYYEQYLNENYKKIRCRDVMDEMLYFMNENKN